MCKKKIHMHISSLHVIVLTDHRLARPEVHPDCALLGVLSAAKHRSTCHVHVVRHIVLLHVAGRCEHSPEVLRGVCTVVRAPLADL